MSRISDEIKQLVTMQDVVEMYGFKTDRKGFMPCPFHSEKTASLKIKDKSFKCFGCGVNGSILDFVMHLFNITFEQATVRLNADFNLGLTNEQPDPLELQRLRAERAIRDKELALFRAEYEAKTELFRRLRNVPGPSEDGEVSDEYLEALRLLPGLEYYFEVTDWR